MYAQNVDDVQRILFGNDTDLATLFPAPRCRAQAEPRILPHRRWASAFPHPRVEYMSGAIARKGAITR